MLFCCLLISDVDDRPGAFSAACTIKKSSIHRPPASALRSVRGGKRLCDGVTVPARHAEGEGGAGHRQGLRHLPRDCCRAHPPWRTRSSTSSTPTVVSSSLSASSSPPRHRAPLPLRRPRPWRSSHPRTTAN
jgi:hypothetical protein